MKMRYALLAVLLLAACAPGKPGTYAGYAEGEFLYLAPREPGILQMLAVEAGQQVAQGAPLFALDAERHRRAADNAKAARDAALARAADLAAGARPEELRELQAATDLAAKTAKRLRELYARGQIPKAQLDQAEAALTQAQAALANGHGGRSNAIEAAANEARAATAALEIAALNLADRTLTAPAAGRIETVFHRPGEMIGAGQPVVSLLPPERMKVRFFVGESDLSKLKIGQRVKITCDACAAPLDAPISFIAAEPQFTPPVIYSLDERHKLVYLVEARPVGGGLRPGQPVDVSLAP